MKQKLHDELHNKIALIPNYNDIFCIIIPVEEIEAWFLSDTDCLKKKFPGISLKEVSTPANISNPKEFIENKSKVRCKPRYLHTAHNVELAKNIDINLICNKCPEFKRFHNYISQIV